MCKLIEINNQELKMRRQETFRQVATKRVHELEKEITRTSALMETDPPNRNDLRKEIIALQTLLTTNRTILK